MGMSNPRYLVVVGGSYVGLFMILLPCQCSIYHTRYLQNADFHIFSALGVNAAQQLATTFAGRYTTLLIEQHSHFQHLFAFPRFAVATGVDTHKAFIPYHPGTFANCEPESGHVIQAKVTSLSGSAIQLDRNVTVEGRSINSIPYDYLVSIMNLGNFHVCQLHQLINFRSLPQVQSLVPRRTYPDLKRLME